MVRSLNFVSEKFFFLASQNNPAEGCRIGFVQEEPVLQPYPYVSVFDWVVVVSVGILSPGISAIWELVVSRNLTAFGEADILLRVRGRP